MRIWKDTGRALSAALRSQRLRDDRWINRYLLDLYVLHDAAQEDARIVRLVREAMA